MIEVTDFPAAADEAYIIAQTRGYNLPFVENDVRRLCVFDRGANGKIIAGLTGKTYWSYLEVAFLWVHEEHRRAGHGAKLMMAAEAEARKRGCRYAFLDTYSFQALGFYQKLGYAEFGRLTGFCGKHDRIYLRKEIADGG